MAILLLAVLAGEIAVEAVGLLFDLVYGGDLFIEPACLHSGL